MAKRKTPSKKGNKKKVGASTQINAYSPLIQLAAVGLGMAAATPINAGIDKINKGKIDNKIVAGGQVAVGTTFLLVRLSKKRSMLDLIPVGAGGVFAGAGLVRAYHEFKGTTTPAPGIPAPAPTTAIQGYQGVPVLGSYQAVPVLGNRVAGYNVPPGIGGYNVPSPIMGSMGGVRCGGYIGG